MGRTFLVFLAPPQTYPVPRLQLLSVKTNLRYRSINKARAARSPSLFSACILHIKLGTCMGPCDITIFFFFFIIIRRNHKLNANAGLEDQIHPKQRKWARTWSSMQSTHVLDLIFLGDASQIHNLNPSIPYPLQTHACHCI